LILQQLLLSSSELVSATNPSREDIFSDNIFVNLSCITTVNTLQLQSSPHFYKHKA